MSDPVTIGALAASALALAAPELLKSAVGEAVKDAYKALKAKISTWASGDVQALEARPTSKGLQIAVAEIVDAQSEADKEALRVLVQSLLARLKESGPAIGLDIGRLTALEAQIGNITVTSGIGARTEEGNVGTFKTGDITVGGGSGKI